MKKIKVAFFVLALVLLGACNGNPNGKQGKSGDAENDSILTQKTYHSSGGLWKVSRAKKIIVNGKEKFIMDGENLEYYKTPKNALSSKAIYKDGKRDGLYQKFYAEGNLYYKVNYKEGKMDGVKTSYYKDGKIMAETPYKKGLIGVGTKEYTSKGIEQSPMELKVWYEKNGSAITLFAKVLNKGKVTKRAKFYNGYLIEGEYFHKNLQEMPVKNGIAEFTIHNPAQFLVISTKVKSARNNYFFLKKEITIK